jgi:hypothetical protein
MRADDQRKPGGLKFFPSVAHLTVAGMIQPMIQPTGDKTDCQNGIPWRRRTTLVWHTTTCDCRMFLITGWLISIAQGPLHATTRLAFPVGMER